MLLNPKRASIYKLSENIDIVSFIKKMFTFLKSYDMCFLSGTIIFEDNNNKLFNFLTYGYLIDNNIIDCNKKLQNVDGHITFTHNNVYNIHGVESGEKCAEYFLNKKKNY